VAVINPPAFLQAGSYPARHDRLFLTSARCGPFSTNTTAPTARSGFLPGQSGRQANFSMTNWDVTVGAFIAVVENTFAAAAGEYEVINDVSLIVSVTPSSPTTNRIDIVGVRVQDAFYSGVLNQADVVVVQGTPTAGVPADPALPSSFLPIARVTVNAATSTGVTADLRKRTSVSGATYFPYTPQLTDNGTFVGETQILPAAGVYPARKRVWDGTAWKGVTPWLFAPPAQSGSGNVVAGASLVVATVSVADPGFGYKLAVAGELEWVVPGATSPNNLMSVSTTLDSSTFNVGEIRRGYALSFSLGASFTQPSITAAQTSTAALTGAHDIRLIAHNFSAVTLNVPAASIAVALTVTLVPS
jgi:hypothetical protein